MKNRIVRLTSDQDHELVFSVDVEFLDIRKHLEEVNGFFVDAKDRLELYEESVDEVGGHELDPLIASVANLILGHAVGSDSINAEGLIREFDWDEGQGCEGFCKMDGTYGMRIVYWECPDFDADDAHAKFSWGETI